MNELQHIHEVYTSLERSVQVLDCAILKNARIASGLSCAGRYVSTFFTTLEKR